MRLIDADALILDGNAFIERNRCNLRRSMYADDYNSALSEIDGAEEILGLAADAPTVDAVPVRHGRWERTSKSLAACSECGNCIIDDRVSDSFYCPNCGSKMDKEEK